MDFVTNGHSNVGPGRGHRANTATASTSASHRGFVGPTAVVLATSDDLRNGLVQGGDAQQQLAPAPVIEEPSAAATPPDEIGVLPGLCPAQPAAAAGGSATFRAEYLGVIKTVIPFPVAGALSGGEFRRQTERVMAYVATRHVLLRGKGVLKDRVSLSVTDGDASTVAVRAVAAVPARRAQKGAGADAPTAAVPVNIPLKDVLAYRTDTYKFKGRKRIATVLMCRDRDVPCWREDTVECHRFVFSKRGDQKAFLGLIQQGFCTIAAELAKGAEASPPPAALAAVALECDGGGGGDDDDDAPPPIPPRPRAAWA